VFDCLLSDVNCMLEEGGTLLGSVCQGKEEGKFDHSYER